MNTKWVAGMMILWFVVTLVSLILDAQYIGSEQTADLNKLLHPSFLAGADIPFIGFFVISWSYISIFIGTLTFDYTFLTGSWEILRWLGISLSIATIIGLILALRGS